MKIACVIHSLDGGGAERVMARTASELVHRGHDVHLITLDGGESDRHAVEPAVVRHPQNVLGTRRSVWGTTATNVATATDDSDDFARRCVVVL